jgi:glycosyltransferase involved in cell wall biosynthesis
MHIAIDAHAVGTRLAGNETYARHLVEALAEIDQTNSYTLFVTRRAAEELFRDRWPNFTVRRTLPHTPLVRIPVTLEVELRRRPVDVLHVQFTAPPFAPCPVVATVHDLAFEHLPETFRPNSWMQMRLTVRRTVRRAAHVLASSEHTRRDLIETYGLAPDKVTTTLLAAPPDFRPVENETELRRVREKYGLPEEYVLAVGSIQPRKNLVRLIEAYSYLHQQGANSKLPALALVGKRAWLYGDTLRAVAGSGCAEKIIFTGYVSEDDLPPLYSGAACFVYPSYFEGFGLPPLEAMQCGAPVIAGNRTSLPEVVGDAGLQCDPFDTTALAEVLLRVLENPDLRAELRVKGLARARRFHWHETARLTLAAYQRAANAK